MTIHFSELRSPQIAEAAKAGAVLVLPFGQTEEHGPHLPINCDSFIAERVSEEAVRQVQAAFPCYVLDPIRYGYSQHVLREWPGTFTMPQETLIEVLRHILVSLADMGLKKVVLPSFHGNHDGVSRVVARMLADERGMGPGVVFPVSFLGEFLQKNLKAGPQGSCHAGEFETSVMLHLAPDLVDMSAASAEDKLNFTSPYPSSQAFVSTWTRQKSTTGAYGDPTVATAELGKECFTRMVNALAEFIRYYRGVKQL